MFPSEGTAKSRSIERTDALFTPHLSTHMKHEGVVEVGDNCAVWLSLSGLYSFNG